MKKPEFFGVRAFLLFMGGIKKTTSFEVVSVVPLVDSVRTLTNLNRIKTKPY